jgi:hypothetical protein
MVAITGLILIAAATQSPAASGARARPHGNAIYMRDDSDWWSIGREEGVDNEFEDEQAEPGDVPFSILGISLMPQRGVDWFSRIEGSLGRAKEVRRGDAASGRRQLCYRSQRDGVNLVFERGEVDFSFYLFSDGQTWNGIQYCAASRKVMKDLSTQNGLRLGLSEAETKAILGDPTETEGDKRWYRFRAHRLAPSGAQGVNELEDWDISETVGLRFSEHHLIYLAVARSEVN